MKQWRWISNFRRIKWLTNLMMNNSWTSGRVKITKNWMMRTWIENVKKRLKDELMTDQLLWRFSIRLKWKWDWLIFRIDLKLKSINLESTVKTRRKLFKALSKPKKKTLKNCISRGRKWYGSWRIQRWFQVAWLKIKRRINLSRMCSLWKMGWY